MLAQDDAMDGGHAVRQPRTHHAGRLLWEGLRPSHTSWPAGQLIARLRC